VSGKPGRSGRPAIGGPKVPKQVRLELDEAEALERYVADCQREALEAGAVASEAAVLRKLIRAQLIAEGYLEAPALEAAKPKKKAARR
jgi:hypothetical protein